MAAWLLAFMDFPCSSQGVATAQRADTTCVGWSAG